ncbi:hypothetical protein PGT21_030960 [Puccinia graminis f. sp. tritici]|uniref:Retrotransposon gag domain-containing protein n=1 Tax=Puccinia graminis f. sp. tritici TaxID=56615 RepID=A0A5B0PZ70_PUCGR|nr:hypothetical protein PGT21_030960 [Puccinia graminis f. sp. tritici]KAA1109259.1 hypothetical protein PGTUg99_023572 [Puccinia graminis f. sp. tritici]
MSDDNSQPSPITPIGVSLPSSPSPSVMQFSSRRLPVPTSTSIPAPFFTINTPSPIPQSMLEFSPRPIASPILPDSLPLNQPDPSRSRPFHSQSRPTTLTDNDVSALLSDLQLNNDSNAQSTSIHAQTIADLKSESRRDKTVIRQLQIDLGKLKIEMSKLKSGCHEEFLQLRSSIQQEFLQVRSAFDTVSSSTSLRFDRLESVSAVPAAPVKKAFVDPVYYSHIFFSGAPKETNSFCFFMRNTLERLHSQFADEKHKVMWLAGYFRSESGRLGDVCPSYNWWRGLLGKNAQQQGLNSLTASSRADFVLEELQDAESFLVSIEATFSNHREVEEARKALKAARQGTKTVEEFNIIFNSLLYSVDLSEASKCEIYDEAINQDIVKLGMFRGGWTSIKTLQAKQDMAASLAMDLGGVGFYEKGVRQKAINQVANQQRSQHRSDDHRPATQLHPDPARDGGPMDIDAIIAAEIEATGFSYSQWRFEAKARKLCIRCGRQFDKLHKDRHSCPVDPKFHLKTGDMAALLRDWGCTPGEAVSRGLGVDGHGSADAYRPARADSLLARISTDRPEMSRLDKGKKRESVSQIENQPSAKRSPDESLFGGRDAAMASTSVEVQEPLSAGELFFASRLADMDIKD